MEWLIGGGHHEAWEVMAGLVCFAIVLVIAGGAVLAVVAAIVYRR